MALVMSLSLCVGAFAAENTATTAEEETAFTNVIQPRDFMTLNRTQRVSCVAEGKTCTADITVTYGVRYEESNASGYYIATVGGVRIAKVSGWASVKNPEIQTSGIVYRENRQYAEVPVIYEACVDSARYETYQATVIIDLTV